MVEQQSAREDRELLYLALLNLLELDKASSPSHDHTACKPNTTDTVTVERTWSVEELLEEQDRMTLGDFTIADYDRNHSDRILALLLDKRVINAKKFEPPSQ